MTVTVERQVVYLGAGLTQTAWIVWDGDTQVGWDTDQAAARQRAYDVNEQKEHRDGE
jgi:hypothetical protein